MRFALVAHSVSSHPGVPAAPVRLFFRHKRTWGEAMRTGLSVRVITPLLIKSRGLFVLGAMHGLLLSLGCGKPVEHGKNDPAPGTIEPPKPPIEPVDNSIRGRLQFGSLPSHLRAEQKPFEGITVDGVGNDHRKYIAGSPVSYHRAIWHFDKLPQTLMVSEDAISAKLTCSIFPIAKRAPDDAVITVRVVSHTCPQTPPNRDDAGEWHWTDAEVQRSYQKRAEGYTAKGSNLRNAKLGTDDWKAVNQLAEEYGYYEVQLPPVFDRTETNIDLPVSLFRNALKSKPEVDANGKPKRPLASI